MRAWRVAAGVGLVAAMAAGCPGCPPTTTKGTTTSGPGNPVSFDADNDLKTCTFTYSPGGSSLDPDFTLNYGGKGITPDLEVTSPGQAAVKRAETVLGGLGDAD